MNVSDPTTPLIEGAKKRLALHGPDRVLVDNLGTAVGAFRAKTEFNIEAEVVLIRADGWMLGAPWKLRDYAHSIWKSEWAAEIPITPRPPKPEPKPALPGKPFPPKPKAAEAKAEAKPAVPRPDAGLLPPTPDAKNPAPGS